MNTSCKHIDLILNAELLALNARDTGIILNAELLALNARDTAIILNAELLALNVRIRYYTKCRVTGLKCTDMLLY